MLRSHVNSADGASPMRVRRERADGTVLWSVAAPLAVGVAAADHANVFGGVLAMGGDRVYLAQYHRMATGGSLSALAAADGHSL